MTSPSDAMRTATFRSPDERRRDADGLLNDYVATTAVTASADLVRRFHERLAAEPAPTPARSFVSAVGRLEVRGAWGAFGEALSAAFGGGQTASRLRFQSLAVVLAVVLAVGGAVGGGSALLGSIVRRPGSVSPGHPVPTQTQRPSPSPSATPSPLPSRPRTSSPMPASTPPGGGAVSSGGSASHAGHRPHHHPRRHTLDAAPPLNAPRPGARPS